MYCSDCGVEMDESVSFCPDCGSEVGVKSSEPRQEQKERAPCQKCDEMISVDAMKCPQCGFEPSASGILGSIFAIISFLWAGFGVLMYIAIIATLATGNNTVGGTIGLLLITTGFIVAPVTYLYLIASEGERKPTEPLEIFGKEVG